MFHKEAIETNTLELLKGLQAQGILKDFYLAGGTSLAIQIGHRKSMDLDLFTQKDFDTNSLLEHLEETYNFRLNFSSHNTLKGFIGDVNVDFISHKYPLVKSLIAENGIGLYSIEDIAAMKLNAIAGDGTRSKDFIDIYFILKQYSIEEIIGFYKTKYTGRNQLHVIKSLNYFDEISREDLPIMLLEKNLTLKKVEKVISSHIKDFSKKLIKDK
jgi:hypothetical protein